MVTQTQSEPTKRDNFGTAIDPYWPFKVGFLETPERVMAGTWSGHHDMRFAKRLGGRLKVTSKQLSLRSITAFVSLYEFIYYKMLGLMTSHFFLDLLKTLTPIVTFQVESRSQLQEECAQLATHGKPTSESTRKKVQKIRGEHQLICACPMDLSSCKAQMFGQSSCKSTFSVI